ncbi:MAG: hypothetical protein WCC48_08235, partial [Anaeromyxobacteraceae bacterium]
MLLAPARRRAWSGAAWGAVLAAAGACAALIWAFGHRHLGGFDHGALVELCWRVAGGQRPVTDFPSTLPVGFVLACGYAFRLFGVSWSSVVALQAVFAAVTLVWSYALLLRITRAPLRSLLIALAIQASGDVVTSYWWYNPATTTLGAVFFLSAAAFWREPRARPLLASYLAALVFLAGMKPNVAGVLVLGVSALLFLSPEHRARVVALSAAGLALFSGWLFAEGLRLPDVIRGYLSISGRGFSFDQFLQDLSRPERAAALLLLAASLLPWLARLRRSDGDARGRRLALAAVLAGLYGFVTNGEHKLVDVPLLLLALWWAGECDAPPEPSRDPGAAG